MQRELFISVIIPMYNSAATIERTVESVLNGSYAAYEILLIDDGSTDDTADKCRELMKKDPRIRLVQCPHGGVSRARNAGIDESKGEYLAFIDADDIVEGSYLSRLSELAAKYDADWVVCSFVKEVRRGHEVVYFNAEKVFEDDVFYSGEDIGREVVPAVFMGTFNANIPSNCMCLMRSSVIKDNGLRLREDIPYGEDMLFNYSFSHYIDRFYYSTERLYTYLFCEKSATVVMEATGELIDEFIVLTEALEEARSSFGADLTVQEKRWIYATAASTAFRCAGGRGLTKRRAVYACVTDKLEGSAAAGAWKAITPADLRGKREKAALFFLKHRMFLCADAIYNITHFVRETKRSIREIRDRRR